jgi:hypothetical protein
MLIATTRSQGQDALVPPPRRDKETHKTMTKTKFEYHNQIAGDADNAPISTARIH